MLVKEFQRETERLATTTGGEPVHDACGGTPGSMHEIEASIAREAMQGTDPAFTLYRMATLSLSSRPERRDLRFSGPPRGEVFNRAQGNSGIPSNPVRQETTQLVSREPSVSETWDSREPIPWTPVSHPGQRRVSIRADRVTNHQALDISHIHQTVPACIFKYLRFQTIR